MATNNYSWARFRQIRDNLATLPAYNFDDVVITGPNSPPTSALRVICFPQVSSRWDPAAANPPAPGWWESATVTVSVTWMPNGGALTSRNEFGEVDPPGVSLGFIRLYPHLTHAGTNVTQYAVTWLPDAREMELEAGRRVDSGASPTVTIGLWAQDSHGVFQNAGHFINVFHSSVNYGSVLFNNIT